MKKFLLFIILSSCSTIKLTKIQEKNFEELDINCVENSIKNDSILTVASYNVENLFDDVENGYEYKDYSQKTSNYSRAFFLKKIENIKNVLSDLNPDIIGLQEIETRRAIEELFNHIKDLNYKCFVIADKPQFSIVKTALISKYKIVKAIGYKTIPDVRNILMAKILVNKDTLVIFVNHWKSKVAPESERIKIAKIHRKILDSLFNINPKMKIISLGDFNTNFDDSESDVLEGDAFNYKPIVGLKEFLTNKNYLYDLWNELRNKEIGSHYFKNKWGTLDHILISQSLLDTNSNIFYIKNSFNVFKADYLLIDGIPYRWQVEFEGNFTIHLGKGFSDHLPIYAKFKIRN
ncbi:MAG: endonuclease/exonuclease/phosphatase family protein [candidate division WOR-3 bacterium]